MNRRDFLKNLSLLPAAGIAGSAILRAAEKMPFKFAQSVVQPGSKEFFGKVMDKARKNNWKNLPIGQSIGNIALEFQGTPYVGGTLEGEGPEVCRTNLNGLDCVTFVESCLCLARIIRKNKTSYDDFINEVTLVRYRQGSLDGYISRLHYTSDWIFDNQKKGVVKDITSQLGSLVSDKACLVAKPDVFFMSHNPQYYMQLKNDPAMVKKIASIENEINSRKGYVLPKELISKAYKGFQTGDIIALATNKKGLDYAHMGYTYIKDGVPHLLHASSKKKLVVLDVPVHEYAASVEAITGVTVVRPE